MSRPTRQLLSGDEAVALAARVLTPRILFDGLQYPEVVPAIRRTVVANSWSKTFAIPGEGIRYLAASPRLEERAALRDACAFGNRVLDFVNAPAIRRRVVADAIEIQVEIGQYQGRRDVMCDALARMGYCASKSERTFYVFPKTPIPGDIAFARLLAGEGVLGVPGAGFSRAGYLRLSLTVPMNVIERSLAGFERALQRARQ